MCALLKEDVGKLITITNVKEDKEITFRGYLVDIKDNFYKIRLLDNGYNVDVLVTSSSKVTIEDQKISLGKPKVQPLNYNKDLPNIVYIGTGGTIGTHVDYNTGGVFMCRTPEEIISTTPELEKIINIKETKSPFIKASEDLGYKDWQEISKIVYNSIIQKEIDGVIITHGTDTLSWTGSAISFLIDNINKPVLLVGAQKSPDRASFDGSMNLICAAHFVKEKIPGVYTVMHGSINDDFCYVIKAVKSKKLHTSRRDSFRAINDYPIAKVYQNGTIEYLVNKNEIVVLKQPILNNLFCNKVAIIKVYPDSDPKIIDWYLENNYKGLVIEGTALGHVPILKTENGYEDNSWLPYLKKAIENNVIVIMCSQSIFGRVNGKVYANLRHLEKIGVEFLEQHDMLVEVAYLKLANTLSRFKTKKEIINFMKINLVGEISNKEIAGSFEKSLE
ncbi:MAG: Glu-tRNA(Gln) amidotransferase subunit GatD [archaeon]|nr:Glu-tRNA(Gln) amidotransferase subunit GatD [archaeon]MDD2477722.1 Glu-tRNA(Gln) amidotransferase subunit GatD [Candidatus ainarchaeum sp.]MDD3084575.1 Glu-tRNA(Gln) amidotransferase subunit GatD [Candidatus ainarchaeum sp.]MDD4221299.1 Glu-tRNA(Gln) amidotransferase subunit GatD [Candidatus ainarchaeum sp.]MDD4662767.1 Glu-tRNA(Gln) amidotransferase subunit GatD [Candidatus ainarchaeum sp.]